MESLASQVMEEYFLERFPEELVLEEAYHLLLLVLGEKPGVLVMSVGSRQRSLLEEFAREFDLRLKVVKGSERSLLDKILGRDTRFERDSIFVTTDEDRFGILEDSDGDFNGFSDESVGKFLGYPSSAIDYYNRVDIPGLEFDNLTDLASEEEFYLSFLGYIPDPKKVQEAVEIGKTRADILRKLDGELDVEIGSFYIGEIAGEKNN